MNQKIINGILLDEQTELSLNDLSRSCCRSAEWIIELVEEGALEPISHKTHGKQITPWRFTADSLHRAQIAMRLQRDLNINLAGIALALELMEQIDTLESKLRRLQTETF